MHCKNRQCATPITFGYDNEPGQQNDENERGEDAKKRKWYEYAPRDEYKTMSRAENDEMHVHILLCAHAP